MILCPVCQHPTAIASRILTVEADVHGQHVACGTCHAIFAIEIRLMRGSDLTYDDLKKRMNLTT